MRPVAAVVALVLVLASCAERPTPREPGVPQPSGTSTESTAPASPAELTLRGKVEPGIEAGCTTLATNDGLYLLLGPSVDKLKSGAEVEVTGRVSTDVMSICQQGTPFIVEKVHPR